MIPHNRPTLDNQEIQAVKKVIKSGWVAQGEQVAKFEDRLCTFFKAKPGQAVAVSSGTSALYLALLALKVKSGQEVIVPTYVCSAVLNAIYMIDAKPVLVDINPADLNLDFKQTKKKINNQTAAIILTHTFGLPAEIDKFIKLKVPIIEDCCQAIGSKYKGRAVGTFGDIATFSFYASKMITTGNGGMVFSKNKRLINQVRDYREFDGRQNYQPRFNFQLSDINAVIGQVQLKKLPQLLKKRKNIVQKYYQALSSDKTWPLKIKDRQPNYYRFLIRSNNINKLKKELEGKGIKTIIPTETYELLHRYLKRSPKKFPIAEKVTKTTLSLPIFPSLKIKEVEYIADIINSYYKKCGYDSFN